MKEIKSQRALSRRFDFGNNWWKFLSTLDEPRIMEAEDSLRSMLGVASLHDKRFLDIGSGSGLFSLAAMRLGVQEVHSFDFDSMSVECTKELKRRYFPANHTWHIERGSVLDEDYLSNLGRWDIVYSWGVLHHTGQMWQALANVADLVKPKGTLFLSIYNDQGRISKAWCGVKFLYNSNSIGKMLVLSIFIPALVLGGFFLDLLRFNNPLSRYWNYKKLRGMSIWHDWLDWLGGYPFEVARPEEIFKFFHTRDFELTELVTRSSGCNEFVFYKKASA